MTTLYRNFSPIPTEETAVISQLENNLDQINSWMNENCLKLNPGKTEFILCMDVSHSAYKYARRLFFSKTELILIW